MKEPLLGAVLVGGRSRRMGRDKALLEWQGSTLLQRAVDRLTRVCDEVVAVTSPEGPDRDLSFPTWTDRHPGVGPLAGLEVALDRATPRSVFALACDLPCVTDELVEKVIAAYGRGESTAVAAAWQGSVQPLCGAYGSLALPVIREQIRRGHFSCRELLDQLDAGIVEVSSFSPRRNLLLNVNRPEDLERLTQGGRELAGGGRI